MRGERYTSEDGNPTSWNNVIPFGGHFQQLEEVSTEGFIYFDSKTGVVAYLGRGEPVFYGTSKLIRRSLSKIEKSMEECNCFFKFKHVPGCATYVD
jgi:hypothetical protein